MTTNSPFMVQLPSRATEVNRALQQHQTPKRKMTFVSKLKRLTLVFLLGAIALTLASCNPPSAPNVNVDVRTPVQVQAVRLGDIENLVVATGTLRPREVATVDAQVLGRLYYERDENGERFYEGHQVKKGDVLARIAGEEAELNLNLPAKKEAFEIAKREYNRQVSLHEEGIITERDFEQTRQTFTNAEAEYRRALLDERNTEVFAPMDGIILKLARDQDDILLADETLIGSGQLIAQVADISVLEASIDLIGPQLNRIEIGDPVRIKPSATYDEISFTGTLERISPLVNQQNHTFQVVVIVPNEEMLLRPGSFVEVEIIVEQRLQVPYVSLDSVKKNYSNNDVVFVVEGQRVQERRVRLGLRDDEHVEILEGVEPGERVVFGGVENLYDNVRVNVIREQ